MTNETDFERHSRLWRESQEKADARYRGQPVFAVQKLTALMKPDANGHSVWKDMLPILHEHWTEVAMFKEILVLNVHVQRYIDIERAGRLHIVTLWLDGKLHGYSVHIIVNGHPHYKQLTWAEDDVHFIHPAYRGTGIHEDMRAFALRTLKERGVDFVTARTKVGHQHDMTLRQMGFKPLDNVYGLNLRDWQPPS